MSVFAGNTSTTVTYVANVACQVTTFRLTNKEAGGIVINMWITVNSTNVYILPFNLALDEGDMVILKNPFELNQDDQLTILTSGSLDYYITLKNEAD